MSLILTFSLSSVLFIIFTISIPIFTFSVILIFFLINIYVIESIIFTSRKYTKRQIQYSESKKYLKKSVCRLSKFIWVVESIGILYERGRIERAKGSRIGQKKKTDKEM